MKKIEPMTQIGQLLEGKEATFHEKKLNEAMDAIIMGLEREAKKGLSKEAFADNKEHIHAWHCAKLVVHSIKLFHDAK